MFISEKIAGHCRISNIARTGDRYRVSAICHHAEERPAPWVGDVLSGPWHRRPAETLWWSRKQ
jgi:hypothetical protein